MAEDPFQRPLLNEEKGLLAGLFDQAFAAGEPVAEPVSGERYRILEKLAEGGSKAVFRVEDSVAEREVAMALLKSQKAADQELFLREARITANLQHPHIMPVYDIGEREEGPFFTMKLVAGAPLNSQKSGQKPLGELLEIFLKTCDAIAYAHDKGLLHLDLKPDNIHVSAFGEVLVLDWGLAKIVDADCEESHLEKYSFDNIERKNLTLHGMIKGTPGYMAPEQCGVRKKKTRASDVYALGAILYELLTGELPVSGT